MATFSFNKKEFKNTLTFFCEEQSSTARIPSTWSAQGQSRANAPTQLLSINCTLLSYDKSKFT